MDAIWNNGVSFIIWFQSLGSWLIYPMKFFSFLGSEEFFLFLLPLVYWCIDTTIGLRIGVIIMFSSSVNEIFKLALHGPRPYWFNSHVKSYGTETSFGVPSGHAQTATSFWGMAATQIKHRWAWFLAIFLILMVGLSRLYLGVHFPHDVISGWILGALTLWAFSTWWDIIARWASKKTMWEQVALAFAFSIALLVLGIIAFHSLQNWKMPGEWLANSRKAGASMDPDPISLNNIITSTAVLFGLFAGLAWMNSRGGFDAKGNINQRILRLLPGLLGVFIFYFGLRTIFPSGNTAIPLLLRYLRYSLVGLWMTAGAPWLFGKLNLLHKINL